MSSAMQNTTDGPTFAVLLEPLTLEELSFSQVWAVTSIILAISVVAMLGNLVAFLMTSFCKTRSHFHSICIANLALADFVVGLLVPLQWLLYLQGLPEFQLSAMSVHIIQTSIESMQTISVSSMVLITLDRVCITLWPVRYHNRDRQMAPLCAVTSIWVVGPAIHVVFFILELHSHQPNRGPAEFYMQPLLTYFIGIEFGLPLVLLTACNTAIYYKVSNREKPFCRGQPSSFSKSSGGGADLQAPEPLCPTTHPGAACIVGGIESAGSFHRLLSRRQSTPSQLLAGGGSSRRHSIQSAVQILRDLRCHRRSANSATSTALPIRDHDLLLRQILRRQHRRTLKLLVLLVLLFLLCRCPRAVFLLVQRFWPTPSLRVDYWLVPLNLLVQLNAALDPLAYSFWGNRLYKRRVRKCLGNLSHKLRHWRPFQ